MAILNPAARGKEEQTDGTKQNVKSGVRLKQGLINEREKIKQKDKKSKYSIGPKIYYKEIYYEKSV
jgi:hypothetical protein